MALAIFDLDETLISTDSDHAWGDYVVDAGLVNGASHKAINHAFYEDYKRGELDVDAYMKFACSTLSMYDMETLYAERTKFVEQCIKPHYLTKGQALVDHHKAIGDTVIVVTATIEFVTRPVVDLFDIEHLIAPMPEIVDGRYTGQLSGVPSIGAGKVTRLKHWMTENDYNLVGSHFYSDSANDLPLLEAVDHPIAVNPDPRLNQIALDRAWQILSLR